MASRDRNTDRVWSGSASMVSTSVKKPSKVAQFSAEKPVSSSAPCEVYRIGSWYSSGMTRRWPS